MAPDRARRGTDASGLIIHWSFLISPHDTSAPATDFIHSCDAAASLGPGDNCGSLNVYDAVDLNPVNDGLELGVVNDHPGTWSVTPSSAVPTLPLSGLVILGVLLLAVSTAMLARRASRQSAADPTH
jgi:hypothetical protein